MSTSMLLRRSYTLNRRSRRSGGTVTRSEDMQWASVRILMTEVCSLLCSVSLSTGVNSHTHTLHWLEQHSIRNQETKVIHCILSMISKQARGRTKHSTMSKPVWLTTEILDQPSLNLVSVLNWFILQWPSETLWVDNDLRVKVATKRAASSRVVSMGPSL